MREKKVPAVLLQAKVHPLVRFPVPLVPHSAHHHLVPLFLLVHLVHHLVVHLVHLHSVHQVPLLLSVVVHRLLAVS